MNQVNKHGLPVIGSKHRRVELSEEEFNFSANRHFAELKQEEFNLWYSGWSNTKPKGVQEREQRQRTENLF